MKSSKLKTLLGALLVSGTMGVASQAYALNIVPADADWTTNITNNLETAADIQGVTSIGGLALAYKIDYDDGGEDGSGMNYYSTVFTTDSGGAVGATITQAGGLWIKCPTCVLVVKDGNQGNPAQYLFNINDWNGTDDITLSGFWAGEGVQGSISNIAIWNTATDGTSTLVPEADTYAMLLAGLGLVGFAARRKLGKTA